MHPPDRREFNRLLLAGAAATLLPACSAYDGQVSADNSQVVLTFAQFASLSSVNGSAVVDVKNGFPLVVVRTSLTAAVALSATCTHEGCIMYFAKGDIHCDCHNADFSLAGAVLRGPPRIPLPGYTATVGHDSITVQLT